MPPKKFTEVDRRKVIGKLEHYLGIRLSPIVGFMKYFSGSDGNKYCVIGGIEDWHGIPKEIINDKNPERTVMIVSRMLKNRIDVFMGKLLPFIESKKRLTLNVDGDYHFDIKNVADDHMYIKQISNYYLTKLFEFQHDPAEAREEEIKIAKAINKLSSGERAELNKLLGLDS